MTKFSKPHLEIKLYLPEESINDLLMQPKVSGLLRLLAKQQGVKIHSPQLFTQDDNKG